MQGLVITLGKYENDGRLREILASIREIKRVDKIDVIGINLPKEKDNDVFVDFINLKVISQKKQIQMLHFYIRAIEYLKKNIHKYNFVVLDNFTVAFLGDFIKKYASDIKIILDSRELYFPENMPSMFSKWLVKKEHLMLKNADFSIVANNERAEILVEKLSLVNKPYAYENIRFLGDVITRDEKSLNSEKTKVIISTGGVSFKRDLAAFLADFIKLNQSEYEFHIYGGATKEELNLLERYIKVNPNIKYFGKIPLKELYMKVCEADIGLVHYHKRDLNNVYCASGKLYEYIGCGIPVITTDNIPLKNICSNYKVGIATSENFDEAIKEIAQNYLEYTENIKVFLNDFSSFNNNKQLTLKLEEVMR